MTHAMLPSRAVSHPAAGVVWLAEQLAARGRWLESGDLVITGGLTAAPYLTGHTLTALFTPPAGPPVTVAVTG